MPIRPVSVIWVPDSGFALPASAVKAVAGLDGEFEVIVPASLLQTSPEAADAVAGLPGSRVLEDARLGTVGAKLNQAARMARNGTLLLLWPNVLVSPDALALACSALTGKVGAVGAALTDAGGLAVHSGLFPFLHDEPAPVMKLYRRLGDEERDIYVPAGAFATSKKAWDRTMGFDGAYTVPDVLAADYALRLTAVGLPAQGTEGFVVRSADSETTLPAEKRANAIHYSIQHLSGQWFEFLPGLIKGKPKPPDPALDVNRPTAGPGMLYILFLAEEPEAAVSTAIALAAEGHAVDVAMRGGEGHSEELAAARIRSFDLNDFPFTVMSPDVIVTGGRDAERTAAEVFPGVTRVDLSSLPAASEVRSLLAEADG